MTDLDTRIRDAFRADVDDRLPADEVVAMRRAVVAAVRAEDHSAPRVSWFQPVAVAATVFAMIVAGVALGERFDAREGADPGGSDTISTRPPVNQPERSRQLHFSTPGGTRIIWIFNSDLDLKTTP